MCVCECVCVFFLISILYVNVRNALIKKYLKKKKKKKKPLDSSACFYVRFQIRCTFCPKKDSTRLHILSNDLYVSYMKLLIV